MIKKRGHKRGLSPVIATVLLIGIVVVSGLITFTWFRGFTQEAVEKEGQNAQLVCNDVEFQASLSDNLLLVSNIGNIPIYGLMVKIENPSGFETRDIREIDQSSSWSDEGIGIGGATSVDVGSTFESANRVTVIPVLRGSSQRGGEASFECEERHGLKISI